MEQRVKSKISKELALKMDLGFPPIWD